MPSQGPNNASSFATNNFDGTEDWSNPGNVQYSDGIYADVFLLSNKAYSIIASGFGFAIPSNANITGVQVDIERASLQTGNIQDYDVFLVPYGNLGQGDNKFKTTQWPLIKAYASYGGINDQWGYSLVPSDINSSNFAVSVNAWERNGLMDRALIDHIRMTVYYSIPENSNLFFAVG